MPGSLRWLVLLPLLFSLVAADASGRGQKTATARALDPGVLAELAELERPHISSEMSCKLPPLPDEALAVLARTWPTASRMSGVARLMERLTRWPEP